MQFWLVVIDGERESVPCQKLLICGVFHPWGAIVRFWANQNANAIISLLVREGDLAK